MIIEIRGVNIVNKGAELMLVAIVSKLKKELKNPLFVMENSDAAPKNKLSKYGIYTKKGLSGLRFPFKQLYRLIPSVLLWHISKSVHERKVDVVLDASGFAFGDVWGEKKASYRLGEHIAAWKEQGKKVILLPQAFGPFSGNKLISVMKTIINHADLIFARDQASLKSLTQLQGDGAKLELAPDFTNLIKGTVPAYFDSTMCEVAIIVNHQMIETANPVNGEAYLDLLYRMIIKIQNLGYRPFFLIHEKKMDISVAEEINKKLATQLPVIREEDPLHVKGIISKSKAVVTSRFHGLVSCLSQGIPCLATGWSHKYEMLLKDYNYGEALLDVHCDDDHLSEKIGSILEEPSRKIIIKNLKNMSLKQKHLSEEMWAKVLNKINGTHKSSVVNKFPALKANHMMPGSFG